MAAFASLWACLPARLASACFRSRARLRDGSARVSWSSRFPFCILQCQAVAGRCRRTAALASEVLLLQSRIPPPDPAPSLTPAFKIRLAGQGVACLVLAVVWTVLMQAGT